MYKEYFRSQLTNFHSSLSPKFNRDMVFKAGEGAGRSGSFFFFSHDRKFIIKTMTKEELQLFLDKLPAFGTHVKQNPNTLLAKIFGVFTVNTNLMKEVHVMLMENTAQVESSDKISAVFDLKGSTVDRLVKGKTKPETTLKDLNFLNFQDFHHRKRGQPLIKMRDVDVKRVIFAIRRDVAFLKSQGLMDYSLLIVIEKCNEKQNEKNIAGSTHERYSLQAQEEHNRPHSTQLEVETLT